MLPLPPQAQAYGQNMCRTATEFLTIIRIKLHSCRQRMYFMFIQWQSCHDNKQHSYTAYRTDTRLTLSLHAVTVTCDERNNETRQQKRTSAQSSVRLLYQRRSQEWGWESGMGARPTPQYGVWKFFKWRWNFCILLHFGTLKTVRSCTVFYSTSAEWNIVGLSLQVLTNFLTGFT